MSAARTKKHKEKHAGIRTEKKKEAKAKKKEAKAKKKQENRTQRVDSKKASRLCYTAEPGTFWPHDLPSSSYRVKNVS